MGEGIGVLDVESCERSNDDVLIAEQTSEIHDDGHLYE